MNSPNSESAAAPKARAAAAAAESAPPRLVAVIDLGATACRMLVAEIGPAGTTRRLDELKQPVALGKDCFTGGRLQQASIARCVEVLQGFQRVMREYGIDRPEQVLAVATSAVREAANRDTLLDRLYTATGIAVRVIDEAEENRLLYLAFQGAAAAAPELKAGDALVVEIGGGSTEVLLVQQERVAFSQSYRLGALRLRETLETYRTASARVRAVLAPHIERTVEQLRRSLPPAKDLRLIATSGDARFAAAQLDPDWEREPLARLDLKPFAALVEKIVPAGADALVRRHRLSYPEAETVGPALLSYLLIARALGVKQLIVPRITLRDGLLRELAARDLWTGSFAEQVLLSAATLARKFQADEPHARHVAGLAAQLFEALQPEHRMERRHFILLQAAAQLHDIGAFVSNRSHHKHAHYLIANSDLFGLSRADVAIVALVARYHRRALPNAAIHPEFAALDRDDRVTVAKLAALLRVADALDRGHLQQVRDLRLEREPGRLILGVPRAEDLTLERMALRDKANLFEEVFGLAVELREERAGEPL